MLVNGGFAFKDGKATGAHTGRFVHGRAWTGAPGGGCRTSAAQWAWSEIAAQPRVRRSSVDSAITLAESTMSAMPTHSSGWCARSSTPGP